MAGVVGIRSTAGSVEVTAAAMSPSDDLRGVYIYLTAEEAQRLAQALMKESRRGASSGRDWP